MEQTQQTRGLRYDRVNESNQKGKLAGLWAPNNFGPKEHSMRRC